MKRFGKTIAGVIVGRRPGATGVFPFRFRRGAIGQPIFLRQPFAKRNGIVPTHEDNRFVIRFGETEFSTEFTMGRIELLILRVGDLEDAHVEWLTDGYFMPRVFIEIAIAKIRAFVRLPRFALNHVVGDFDW